MQRWRTAAASIKFVVNLDFGWRQWIQILPLLMSEATFLP
jgi:hypothetical protein